MSIINEFGRLELVSLFNEFLKYKMHVLVCKYAFNQMPSLANMINARNEERAIISARRNTTK
ncbi:hypothetical protein NEOC65_000106 [Neochlamydia sp. AcF65]|nr:hypothetical protein [Neochlamydia sp. AcF65]NGY94675.1 hypothetical protein [Neochlamydia sp. AcF84]